MPVQVEIQVGPETAIIRLKNGKWTGTQPWADIIEYFEPFVGKGFTPYNTEEKWSIEVARKMKWRVRGTLPAEEIDEDFNPNTVGLIY